MKFADISPSPLGTYGCLNPAVASLTVRTNRHKTSNNPSRQPPRHHSRRFCVHEWPPAAINAVFGAALDKIGGRR